jgi:hypothetical protein
MDDKLADQFYNFLKNWIADYYGANEAENPSYSLDLLSSDLAAICKEVVFK